MALYYKKSLECVFDLLSENNTWHSSMNWPLGCSAMKMKTTFLSWPLISQCKKISTHFVVRITNILKPTYFIFVDNCILPQDSFRMHWQLYIILTLWACCLKEIENINCIWLTFLRSLELIHCNTGESEKCTFNLTTCLSPSGILLEN